MPKVSVIVPVYNVEQYIHRCVDSILNQTFTDFELILINDGSTDNSGKFCDEYTKVDSKVHVIHQKNSGQSVARNIGIDWTFEHSNSEYVTFVDSDDWVHKKYLEILYNSAATNNIDICCCGFMWNLNYVDDRIINSYDVIYGTSDELISTIKEYHEFNTGVPVCRLYKKSCFKNIRFPAGKYFEDEFTIYKILYQCRRIAVVKEILYYYYQNPSGAMRLKPSFARSTDKIDALTEQMHFYYKNNAKHLFQYIFNRLFCLEISYFREYEYDNKYAKAVALRKKALIKCIKDYYDFLPYSYNRTGYKKLRKSIISDKNAFKSDLSCVCKEKGLIYSLFWAVKRIERKLLLRIRFNY